MTDITNRKNLELSFCPFPIVPGGDGRWSLWWAKENHAIASFPGLEAAERFIIGKSEGWPRSPGWDRSDVPIDITPALYRHRNRTGAFPTFEFNEDSNVMDLRPAWPRTRICGAADVLRNRRRRRHNRSGSNRRVGLVNGAVSCRQLGAAAAAHCAGD